MTDATLTWLIDSNNRAIKQGRSSAQIVVLPSSKFPTLQEILMREGLHQMSLYWEAAPQLASYININGLTSGDLGVLSVPIWTETIWKVWGILRSGGALPHETIACALPNEMEITLKGVEL